MVNIEVRSSKLDKAIATAIKEIGDLRVPYGEMAKEFYRSNRFIFRLKSAGKYAPFSGAKIRTTWVPASQGGRPDLRTRDGNMTPYQWWKSKVVPPKGYPLLKLTGVLESSITDPSDGNAISRITKTKFNIGTKVEYAKFHQTGTKKMPMRPVLFLDGSTGMQPAGISKREEAWVKLLDNYVSRVIAKANK
jgi:hypothetical protein